MPSTPTVQAALLPVPGPSHDVPVLAMDLGADHPDLQEALGNEGLARLRVAALAQLREQGLHPVPAGAYVPGPVAGQGWTARLTPGRVEIRTSTLVVYDGTLAAWPTYNAAVQANGWLLLYTGHIDLGFGVEIMPNVRAAVDRGDVVGGVVPAIVAH